MTDHAAVCFGCGTSLERELGTLVGDAMFCRGCLGRMLRRVDERGAVAPAIWAAGRANGTGVAVGPAEGAGERPPVAAAAPADALCFVCGEPLAGEPAVALRGFAICASCARGLVGDDAEPGGDDAEPGGDAAEPPEPARAIPLHIEVTPGSATEWCSGCGRAMPGPGSYQLLDGRPHCAACVAARGASREAEPDAVPGACDACARVAVPRGLRETRGFWLCAACRSSDPELAVALARARHQRRLARASRRLLEGDDE